ncbi:MAG: hypothetical protein ABI467_08600, partial [Kofleriaceae bacterium]
MRLAGYPPPFVHWDGPDAFYFDRAPELTPAWLRAADRICIGERELAGRGWVSPPIGLQDVRLRWEL